MTPDQRWLLWQRAISTPYADIVGLFHNRYMWKGLLDMLEANPDIRYHSAVNDWLTRCYSTTQAVGIRRQSYTDRKQVTLASVMTAIAADPEVATFVRFSETLDEDDLKFAQDSWRDEWGSIADEHVAKERVANDLEALAAVAAPVAKFVNKRLAHHDRDERVDEVPLTFGEIDEALDGIGEMLRRYYRLLTGMQLAHVTPLVGLEWIEMFRTPWATSMFTPRPERDFG